MVQSLPFSAGRRHQPPVLAHGDTLFNPVAVLRLDHGQGQGRESWEELCHGHWTHLESPLTPREFGDDSFVIFLFQCFEVCFPVGKDYVISDVHVNSMF